MPKATAWAGPSHEWWLWLGPSLEQAKARAFGPNQAGTSLATGLTGMYHTMGPHKSLLPWAQSTTHGWVMEFHPSDGMGRPSISTE